MKGLKEMVNKNHPDYEKYIEECYIERDKLKEELSKINQPKIMCKDGYGVAIHKKFAKKIKKIQQKYSYLFTD